MLQGPAVAPNIGKERHLSHSSQKNSSLPNSQIPRHSEIHVMLTTFKQEPTHALIKWVWWDLRDMEIGSAERTDAAASAVLAPAAAVSR